MSQTQLKIAGTERQTNPKVEAKAKPYVDTLYAWKRLGTELTRHKSQLLEVMAEEGVTLYVVEGEDADFQIERTEATKLKCKKLADDTELMDD